MINNRLLLHNIKDTKEELELATKILDEVEKYD